MDSLRETEEFVLLEALTRSEGSFIYELDTNHFFCRERLDRLLRECRDLARLYKANGKSEIYPEVLRGVLSTFQHALFLVSCNFMEDDSFEIQNYEAGLLSEILSDYYIEFRVILNDLIM